MKELRQYTPARVGLGRAGNGVPTRELLDFQLAHARARDAVRWPLDLPALRAEIEAAGRTCLAAKSAAADRDVYLKRPDLGRRLHPDGAEALRRSAASYEAAFVVADGLSALAVHRHAPPLLRAVFERLDPAGWNLAPVVIVEQGRVAIGDEIGLLLGASLAVVMIGERPGLSAPDSLGVYLTWDPRGGRTDGERNCISNIRAEGLSYDAAADLLTFLMSEARRRRLSGVGLKDTRACRKSSLTPHTEYVLDNGPTEK